MINAKYLVAIIERDIAEKIPVTVLMHEIPVLQAVHKKATLHPADIKPLVESKDVDLDDEYERLMAQYGIDEDSGMSFVERVYGRLDEFVQKVEDMYSGESKPKRSTKAKENEQNAG